jgi:AcrR family transcriptional regulator
VFVARGYAAATVGALAAEAGVAVPTLYAAFGSKREILLALVGAIGAEAGRELRDLYERAQGAESPVEQMRAAAELATAIAVRYWDVMEMVQAAAGVDEDLAAAWAQGEAQRRREQAPIMERLHAKGALARGLGAERALDVMWALTGPAMYGLLVVERGWTAEAFERWLAGSLCALLLGDAGAGRGP